LLRVLQEQEFEKIGDSRTIKVDVRVVAATNLDLKEEISQGRFRQDLFYRLKVVEIHLPPLRQRQEDIPLLVDHFILLFNEQFGKQIKGITASAYKALMKYSWPGNIRELRHALEHAFIICPVQMIDLVHLPGEIQGINAIPEEKENLLLALEQARWNKTKAAAKLGISRQSIYRKIKEYNISDV
jgi:two-component system response regulator HydG